MPDQENIRLQKDIVHTDTHAAGSYTITGCCDRRYEDT